MTIKIVPGTVDAYEVSLVVPSVAAGAALAVVRNVANGIDAQAVRLGLVRLSVTLTTAVATSLGLVLATAQGTVLTEEAGLLTTGGAVPTFGRLVSAWSAAPTFAGSPVYFRRELVAGVVGQRLLWEWPEDEPFVMTTAPDAVHGNVYVRNVGAGASADALVNARWISLGR